LEQQTAEIKKQSNGLGSFRKSGDVPNHPEKLSRFQPLNARRNGASTA
jgi:hypothetical protein